MPELFLLRMKVSKIVFLLILALWLLPISGYALPTRVYLNDTEEISLLGGNKYINRTLSANLTANDSINVSFQAKIESSGNFDVELNSHNKSGYLLRINIKDLGGTCTDTLQEIFRVDCSNESKKSLFYNDRCNGFNFNFAIFNNFGIILYPGTNQANITVNGQDLGGMNLCDNVSQIGFVNFIEILDDLTVKNRTVTANNKNPAFIGNLPNKAGISNQTWPENTSIGFNISGNFSDANNDTLTFNLEAVVENITINVNQNTGIVNLTPNPDFFGVRYVRFIANDSSNITFSNNVTLNVTNVNDLPSVTSAIIGISDDLNRTNGTLTASWTFDDKDQDIMSVNETLWYINGVENISLRNSTNIGSQNTTKNQNWSFSVRVSDGTGFSAFFSSSNLTIENALQAFSHALGVETVERGKLFTYDANYTDLDNDNITFSDNSTLFNITSEGIINFTPTTSGNITVNITLSQNPNVTGILTIDVSDTLAPTITAISASSSGTSTVTVTLSVTTDETTICNFATIDLNFSSMARMSSTNSASHSNSQSFSSDTSGTYYVRCNDTIGNVMNFSNSTSFNADVQESSAGGDSGSSGGGGGGGGGGWQCRYEVQCTGWSECADGKQTRECSNVAVAPFYSPTKCEYLLEQETERECIEPPNCSDNIKNQDEHGIDCGGPCGPCFSIGIGEEEVEEGLPEEISVQPEGNIVTGAVTGIVDKLGTNILYSIGIAVIIVSSLFLSKYFRKKPIKLSEEEMKNLNEMMEYSKHSRIGKGGII